MPKAKKEKKITDSMQEVAVEILLEIIFSESLSDFFENSLDKIMTAYSLCKDPFT